jgi:hypothetical protein
MELIAFQKLRGGLKANAAPAAGDALEAAEARLRTLLMSSAMFGNVEVAVTDDPDRLLIAMVNFRPEHTEQEVTDYLMRSWVTHLRYRGWDAHSFLVENEHVEMQAATLHADGSHFVTIHVVATAAVFAEPAIPVQRMTDQRPRGRLRRKRRLTGV